MTRLKYMLMVPILAMVGIFVVPSSAEAASSGCGYPRVCLYAGQQLLHPTGRFQDVTTGWQWLNQSFGARGFKNTRHDDVAYIRTTTGKVYCIRPGTTGGLYNGGATAIRISYRSHC